MLACVQSKRLLRRLHQLRDVGLVIEDHTSFSQNDFRGRLDQFLRRPYSASRITVSGADETPEVVLNCRGILQTRQRPLR